MDREEFMSIVYDELYSDGDNNRANRIIDAADEYAESAQLGTNLAQFGTDCISRRAVIDLWEKYHPTIAVDAMQYDAELRQLPLAQPTQLTEDDIETIRVHLSAIKENLCNQHRWNEAKEYEALIDRLSEHPEPCEDAVSREAVQDTIHKWCGDCVDCETIADEVITKIPLVTPKQRTGYWYPVGMAEAVGGESAQWGSAIAYHRCSECDEQALRDDFEQEVLSKWCPHCGAKMRGTLWK